MPWLTIIMALISFFATKKATGGDNTRALAAAGIAGLGTYYVSHETEWGKSTLGQFDGVVTTPTVGPVIGSATPLNADGTAATKNADGSYTVTNADGTTSTVQGLPGSTIGGTPAITNGGVTVPTSSGATTSSTSGLWDTLKSWGATGTATVIGTAGVATGTINWKQVLPWVAGGLLLFTVLK